MVRIGELPQECADGGRVNAFWATNLSLRP
jgi:hypothetical protein